MKRVAKRSRGFVLTRNETMYWFALTSISLYTYQWRFGDVFFMWSFGSFVSHAVNLFQRRKESAEPLPPTRSLHWHAMTTSFAHLRGEYIPDQLSKPTSRDRTVELILSRLMLYFFAPLGFVYYGPLMLAECLWSLISSSFRPVRI